MIKLRPFLFAACSVTLMVMPVMAQNIKPTFTTSLFFSQSELAEIQAARSGARPLDSDFSELETINADDLLPLGLDGGADSAAAAEEAAINAAAREIKLGGLVYITAKDWTVWLNGQRLTPGNLPDEVVTLNVYNNRVRVKWFDRATKSIYDVTLRPHQKYNIDQDKLLPG